jgi:hypothetical protein
MEVFFLLTAAYFPFILAHINAQLLRDDAGGGNIENTAGLCAGTLVSFLINFPTNENGLKRLSCERKEAIYSLIDFNSRIKYSDVKTRRCYNHPRNQLRQVDPTGYQFAV